MDSNRRVDRVYAKVSISLVFRLRNGHVEWVRDLSNRRVSKVSSPRLSSRGSSRKLDGIQEKVSISQAVPPGQQAV